MEPSIYYPCMNSVNLMSVKVIHDCITLYYYVLHCITTYYIVMYYSMSFLFITLYCTNYLMGRMDKFFPIGVLLGNILQYCLCCSTSQLRILRFAQCFWREISCFPHFKGSIKVETFNISFFIREGCEAILLIELEKKKTCLRQVNLE